LDTAYNDRLGLEQPELELQIKMICIPSSPGAYALQLSIHDAHFIKVGQLGTFYFTPGEYIYLGSALGPGGLRARLRHHIQYKIGKPPHWHIDYLQPVAEVHCLCFLEHMANDQVHKPIECLWSQELSRMTESSIPVSNFGASDCRSGCVAHLFSFIELVNCEYPLLSITPILEKLADAANVSPERLVYHTLFP
jgi:Uri superfamily endonuclease